MSDEWDEEFEELLRRTLPLLPPGAAVAPDLDLLEAGMDSLAVVELIVQVEEGYGIALPDRLLVPSTFASPKALWSAIQTVRFDARQQS